MSEAIYTKGDYLENNPTWHLEDSTWKAEQILNIIKKNNLQPLSVCEVGCGSGEILNQLYLKLPDNRDFIGYEISPQAFQLCQEKNKDRLKFKLGNLIQEEDVFFDLLLCIDVFEHIEDYFTFLRSLRKKAQYKIFHIPLDLSVSSVLRSTPILRARQNVGHLHYFSKETAIATLKETGYEICDYFYTASSIGLPVKHFRTLLGNFPRKVFYSLNQDIAVRLLGGYSLLVLAR
jgi:cyclopropane fatty-acyl-phospholipid synthase-like methyltransferase